MSSNVGPVQVAHPSLDNTFGAVFIGLTTSTLLYGVLCLQTYTYYHVQSDSRILKSLVGIVWLSDTLNEAFLCHSFYHALISNYFNPIALAVSIWSGTMSALLVSFVTLIVQCYFAYQVQRFSAKGLFDKNFIQKNSTSITGTIVFLSFFQFVLGCVFAAKEFVLEKFSLFLAIKWIVVAILVSTVACDLLIAISLCYLLNKSKTGIRHTNTLINSLVVYTMTTGLMSCIFAIITLIFYFAFPLSFVETSSYYVLGKVYSNSLLAKLNSHPSKTQESNGWHSFHLTDLQVPGESGSDTLLKSAA